MDPDSSPRLPVDGGSQDALDRRERNAAEREQRADERDTALDAREVLAAAREAGQAARAAGQADRELEASHILAGAAGRDDDADARDLVAAERDEAASRTAFVSELGDYGVALNARRSAALDRLDAKDDRTASAQDRSKLTRADPSAAQ